MDTVTEARAIFQFIDKNGDGTLDLIELSDGLSDFGLTDAQNQTIFFDLDANSDGQVSKQEFSRGYATFYPHKQGNTNHGGQTGADRDVEPSPADAVVSVAEEQADAVPVEGDAPSVRKWTQINSWLPMRHCRRWWSGPLTYRKERSPSLRAARSSYPKASTVPRSSRNCAHSPRW